MMKANLNPNHTSDMVAQNQNENNTKHTFADVLRAYENAVNANADVTKALDQLGAALSSSVIRKCQHSGYNPMLDELRRELYRDRHNLEILAQANQTASRLTYNKDGELVSETTDKVAKEAIDRLAHERLGDGLDLAHDAIVQILAETKRQRENGEECGLETPYKVRRLKSKVRIKDKESKGGWGDAETVPVREAFKTVRRSVAASRAVSTDPKNGYSYLEELAIDPETGETCEVYRRLSKYADLGGYATDFNGACTLYSVDRQAVEDMDELIERLDLTPRQAAILELRLRGEGCESIATYFGVTKRAIQKSLILIGKKANAIGLTYERSFDRVAKRVIRNVFGGEEPTPESVEYAYSRCEITLYELNALYEYLDSKEK